MGRFLGRLHKHYLPFRTHSSFVNSWELRAQGWDREGRLWNDRSFYYKAPGLSTTGYLYTGLKLKLHPPLPLCPGHASLISWFEKKLPIQNWVGKDALEVPLCSSGVSQGHPKMCCSCVNTVGNLSERFVFSEGHALGIEFLVGLETEWILLKAIPPAAVNNAPWSASVHFHQVLMRKRCPPNW